jgi:hypothetical protein
VLRDSGVMRPGELISGFMKRIGRADRVIVVLSDKYLQSTYCMTELHSIYQRSVCRARSPPHQAHLNAVSFRQTRFVISPIAPSAKPCVGER